MEKYEINKYIEKFKKSSNDITVALNKEVVLKEIEELNKEISKEGFWNNQENSTKTINLLNNLKEKAQIIKEVEKGLTDVLDFYDMLELDEEVLPILEEAIIDYDKLLEESLVKVILSEKYDGNNAILQIHPGAGGTESHDWANMLYRMYIRYFQRKNFKYKVLDFLPGEEAGLKSVVIEVKGKNAYGLLKSERGVHRLVRISPFDSNARRHTSFASVDISPIVDEVSEVKIDDSDLVIDVYRSSGAGGQSVNTTDSAVRITHKPTKTVVTCQNERSQIQNRETAMNVLRSKLIELEILKQEEELRKLKGQSSQNAFGSQIRSYVFCPYTLVKDHRTNEEDGNVNNVIDGALDKFVYAYLKNLMGDK
ncbi:MAG: peptide chain release factor 2 [bacterium]